MNENGLKKDGKRKKPLNVFLLGLITGVVATIFVPALLRPYFPQSLFGGDTTLQGVVRAKQSEVDKVLLTIPTDQGTMLATFTENVAEMNLMIEEGDSIALALDSYEPFPQNPAIARVRTMAQAGSAPPGRPAAATQSAPTDTTLAVDSTQTDTSAAVRDSAAEVPDTTGASG